MGKNLVSKKNFAISARISKKLRTFAPDFQNRDVAQLVAHYVRDVGVGRSSRLIPTKDKTEKGAYQVPPFFKQNEL